MNLFWSPFDGPLCLWHLGYYIVTSCHVISATCSWSKPNSPLCGDQWQLKLVQAHAYIVSNVWIHYKTHTWFIVSILFSKMLGLYLFITIDATHLEERVTFLEVSEVYDITCENNYVELHYWTFKKTPTLITLLFTLNTFKWTSKIPTPFNLT